MKKWMIIGLGALVVFILIGAISVYYVTGAANRAVYKRRTQSLVVETFDAFKKTESNDVGQSLDAFKELKADAEDSADELADRPAPRGAEELKSDAVQVIDLASDIADRGIVMFTYIVAVDESINDWSDEIRAANGESDPVARLEKFKTATEKVEAEVRNLKPPSSLVPFHLELTELLDRMVSKLGETVAAGKANDAAKLKTLAGEWQGMAGELGGLTDSVGKDVADDILTPSDKRKLDRLTREIDDF